MKAGAGCLTSFLLVALVLTLWGIAAHAAPLGLLPNPALTPGALNPGVTPATIRKTICVSGWTATIRPPVSYTNRLKKLQIAQYGYPDKTMGHYEEDHLISLQLGGSPTDPKNLWPQPHVISVPGGNSFDKDVLETRLKRLVCAGKLPLAEAQRAIATDWLAAARKYR